MAMAEYNIDHSVIADMLKNDPIIWAEIYEVAKDAMEHWKEIAPVNKTGVPHTLKSGYVDEPGSYRDSVRMRMIKNPTRWKGRVEAPDYKAFWLEGVKSINKNNDPPPEPMLHTLAYLMSKGYKFDGAIAEHAAELGESE